MSLEYEYYVVISAIGGFYVIEKLTYISELKINYYKNFTVGSLMP